MQLLIQLFISLSCGYFLMVLFNWYNLGKFSWKPKVQRTWFRAVIAAIPCFFVVNSISQSKWFANLELGTHFENLPSYLNFFATVLTAYLLYRTLTSQNRANKVAAFENRYFKFLDYHRENVSQLLYRDPNYKKERYWKGNQVFTIIFYEICDILNDIEKSSSSNNTAEKMKHINLAFQCVFYGAGRDGIRILLQNFGLESLKNLNFTNRLAAYSGNEEEVDTEEKKYYSGHVRRLGHYFRNIYQAIKYVESQEFLNPKQKYEYVTHFRAQMSVYEQSVFFFNSISSLGTVWEWDNYLQIMPLTAKTRKERFEKLLITKYDLIRNTLNNDGEITPGIDLKTFYPLLNLERNEECSVYGVLPFANNTANICRFCFSRNYIEYDDPNEDREIDAYISRATEVELTRFECDEVNCKTKEKIKKAIFSKSSKIS